MAQGRHGNQGADANSSNHGADANSCNGSTPPHNKAERLRRKRLRDRYDELRAILPNANKMHRSDMVYEAFRFIKQLQDRVRQLEKLKQELPQKAPAAAADLGAGGSSSSSQAPPPGVAQVTTLSPDLPQGWAWLPKKKQRRQPDSDAAGAVAPPQQVGFQTWTQANVVMNVSGDDVYITVCAPRRPGLLTMVLTVLKVHRIDAITVQIASDSARSMFSVYARVNVEEVSKLDAEAPASADICKLAMSEILVRLYTPY